jgi:hypothetical protein
MSALIPKAYPALCEAVEVGVKCGYRRAFKHSDCPPEEFIVQQIVDTTLAEIFERFELTTPPEYPTISPP